MNWWWILTLRFCWKGEQRWRLEVGRFKMVFDGCISALFLLDGNHLVARIVGLIQIYAASLESVWLFMLRNRVSLLTWHLFILYIPLLRVICPCTFDGIIFNGTALPIDITTTCYLWLSPGVLNFFLLVEMFGRIAEAIVFRGGYHPRKNHVKELKKTP